MLLGLELPFLGYIKWNYTKNIMGALASYRVKVKPYRQVSSSAIG